MKRLFLIHLLLRSGQTLHQIEGPSGGQVTRIEQGKILLQKEETSLQNAVTVALEMMKPGIDSAGHRLTLTMPIEPIKLVADPARITQIVVNLVGNATKYTPAGGEISLEAFERENTAYIRVGDSGIGIPEDQHDSVFNIFQQVALKDNAKQDGLGIGLALVRHLCELHGGAIDLVHSNPDQGSLFEVRLPIAQPAKLFSNSSEFGTGNADRAPAI